ncbi:MAG: NRDE family protein [Planctomycetes bacterium]|nr:NRDE family protein [Planctomycetota bacterium]
MCVLALFSDPVPGVSLAVAANRDEYLHRLSVPPTELRPGVIGGKDLEAGGTWLGLNRHGLLVAVTNRRIPPKIRSGPSRGVLCLDALAFETPDQVERFVGERTASLRYAGFNLVAMRGGRGVCLQFDGRVRPVRIDGGIHVVSSHRDMDDPRMPERKTMLARVPGWDGMDMMLDRLRSVLADHEETDGWAVCKHGSGYGTVSSSLLVIPSTGLQGVRYWYSAGPSCRNRYEDLAGWAGKILAPQPAPTPM